LDAASIGAVLKRDDIRGLWPQQLNAEVMRLFGAAFAELVRRDDAPAPLVVVGHDARSGSVDLGLAFSHGVQVAGGRVEWLGLVSTEHVYYMTGRYAARYAGGAMVTASHNPREYNGIKLVLAGAQPLASRDLERLRDLAIARLQTPVVRDPRAEFAAFVLERAGMAALPHSPEPRFPVVVAAGNGVGAWAFGPLAQALEPYGFRFSFLDPEPDGDFPRGVPNPLLPAFVRRLRHAVRAQGALLGIGFDGDGDRAGFVDDRGREITGAQVLALVAERKLAAAPPRKAAVIMRNLCGSRLLQDLYGARPDVTLVDTPVGHGRIKLLMRHEAYRDRVLVAGEHSGHYFYPEFYRLDSGMLTALYMLQLVAEAASRGLTLASRLRPWRRRYAWSGEINYEFTDNAGPGRALDAVARQFAAGVRHEVRSDPALDGLERVFPATGPYDRRALTSPDLKVQFVAPDASAGWWFVLRPSGNEPKLRLNVESWGPGAAGHTRRQVAAIGQLIEQAGGRRANRAS